MASGPGLAGRGWFVLVAGWPGSGKSTLAMALAAELDLPLLAKDEVKRRLTGRGGTHTIAETAQRQLQTLPGPVLTSAPRYP